MKDVMYFINHTL